MSESDDRPPRLRVLITYDGSEGGQPPRRRPRTAGPGRPPLRAIAGGGSQADPASPATGGAEPAGSAEPAESETAGRLAALTSRETAGRLAALAGELRQMSHRLRVAAQRIDDLVLAMATLEGLADCGPENLLESLERFGFSGEELRSALALLSLLAEGPDEGPAGGGGPGAPHDPDPDGNPDPGGS